VKQFMDKRRGSWLALLTCLLAVAFAARVVNLGEVPLRGDEAFAVRYWADSPQRVVRDLAQWEPHPPGTFLSFWAWKSAVGESEFAMRYLPALGGWVGVAAVGALARRLLRRRKTVALAMGLAGLHPFLIWHAQDARNYALWFGASAVAMWLFLRATASNRRQDWALYLIAEVVALYLFFLEAFFLVVQAIYLALQRPCRRVVWSAVRSWALLAVMLLPWLVQAWYLKSSGYQGTTADAEPLRLLTWFVPVWLTGHTYGALWEYALPLVWLGVLGIALVRLPRRVGGWLAVWVAVPAVLLVIAATRMSVFHPRYLIAVMPAVLLIVAAGLARSPGQQWNRLVIWVVIVTVPALGLAELVPYYRGVSPKAPNWPVLAAYLEKRAAAGDLILQTLPDPAFAYYYRGPADEISLVPGAPIRAQLQPQVNFYRRIWLVGRSAEAEQYLNDAMQVLSYDTPAGFDVMQFRRWVPDRAEIAVTDGVRFGDIARLAGHTLQGPDSTSRSITLLLYWEPLAGAEVDYVVFVHLSGAVNAAGGTVWDQDDHRPLDGFASTLAWEPGTLYRDPYHLLRDTQTTLPPGTYTLEVGMYDPESGARLPVYDETGVLLGDQYVLTAIDWPPK
jgi:4-amino-4-deoxy-L-arabinose transferase-like glycosyltransferase